MCKVPWHAGYTCEENAETRDENDVAFGVVCETKGWKRCPKCRHCVERVDGCNDVKCGLICSFSSIIYVQYITTMYILIVTQSCTWVS